MTDYASFKYGNVVYPIPTDGTGLGGPGASFLRDADPALFYLIEFSKRVIDVYVGPRLLAEATRIGFGDKVSVAVAEWMPMDPEPYLLEAQVRFPLLATYRKNSKFDYVGRDRVIVDEVEIIYVLPPMSAAEANNILPVLTSVLRTLDSRYEQGFDPAYTPSMPTGTAGEPFWQRAGLTGVQIKSASYGSYMSDAELYFPAVIITAELYEKSSKQPKGLEEWDGALVHEDLAQPFQPTLQDLVVVPINGPLKLTSATPTLGTKAGGTTVTLKGTNFKIGTQPKVFFDDIPATNVVVVDDTTITCKTPSYVTPANAMVDIYLVDSDGQSQVLVTGFTYTTP